MNTITHAIIILAAGVSSRLGRAKQLLIWKDKTLLEHCIHKSRESQLGPVFVVVGARKETIIPIVKRSKVPFAENKDWASGMGSSIRTGLKEALEQYPKLESVLLLLSDQALISSQDLMDLHKMHENTTHSISAAFYNKQLGVPAIFDASWFEQLSQLSGKEGAKKIIAQNKAQVKPFPCPQAAFDVDTEEDYQRLLKME